MSASKVVWGKQLVASEPPSAPGCYMLSISVSAGGSIDMFLLYPSAGRSNEMVCSVSVCSLFGGVVYVVCVLSFGSLFTISAHVCCIVLLVAGCFGFRFWLSCAIWSVALQM
jgi:hypothetical protein